MRLTLTAVFASLFLVSNIAPCLAAPTLLGLNTNGDIFEIDSTTGTLTEKAAEELHDFTLGGIARKKTKLYYVATPSGSLENSIYTLNLKTNTLSHVDLDRAEDDDDVRAMFMVGKKIYAVFYNGSAGTAGVYRVDPLTGVTTLVRDLSALDVEPVGGAFAKLEPFYYLIVKPESDSTRRQLLRFKLKSGDVQLTEILADDGVSTVACERLKATAKHKNFICLAAASATQVDICKLKTNGVATCLSTLSNIERVAGGHTLSTPNEKTFYAIVYELGDSSTQRLVKFNAKGVVLSTVTINTILVGMRYDDEETPPDLGNSAP